MNTTLKIEEAAILAISIFFLHTLHLPVYWWLWPVLFLSPDISMLGYLGGTKAGAFFYNLFHHKAVAVAVIIGGYLLHNEYLLLTGWLLLGHSSFDRMMGYGLKYNDSFQHTHLGMIGKKA
jgi:hypothetical protein